MLTSRDLDILRSAHAHRFIRTDHFKELHFARSTIRSAQMRLRKLWHHGYLDRVYLASVIDGTRRPPRGAGIPIYTLGAKGAAALHEEGPAKAAAREVASPWTIQHHLIVTDFLVALDVATRDRADLRLVEAVHEWDLWRRLADRHVPATEGLRLVPDGAVTLVRPDGGTRETYYLEVVRADVKAGNRTLWEKMVRYAELNHRGAFKELYGHERVRAVLIATTSSERAEHLRSLARALPYGRKLFAFAAYEERDAEGRVVPSLTPARVLSFAWTTVDGATMTLGGNTPSATPGRTAAI